MILARYWRDLGEILARDLGKTFDEILTGSWRDFCKKSARISARFWRELCEILAKGGILAGSHQDLDEILCKHLGENLGENLGFFQRQESWWDLTSISAGWILAGFLQRIFFENLVENPDVILARFLQSIMTRILAESWRESWRAFGENLAKNLCKNLSEIL